MRKSGRNIVREQKLQVREGRKQKGRERVRIYLFTKFPYIHILNNNNG